MAKRKFSGAAAFAPRKRARVGTAYGRRTTRRRPGRRFQKRSNLATMGFLGIEKKFYDTALVGTALVAPADAVGGTLDPSATSMVSTPTQGDGEQQRDGKQISCLYLEVNGYIEIAAIETTANPLSGVFCYLAVVLDSQTNATQILTENVFKNTGASALLAPSPMKNLLFGKRFRILKAKTYAINPLTLSNEAANAFNTNGSTHPFRWFIPLRGLRINFNAATTATIAAVVDNSIHICGFCNRTGLTPTISYNARLRFMG